MAIAGIMVVGAAANIARCIHEFHRKHEGSDQIKHDKLTKKLNKKMNTITLDRFHAEKTTEIIPVPGEHGHRAFNHLVTYTYDIIGEAEESEKDKKKVKDVHIGHKKKKLYKKIIHQSELNFHTVITARDLITFGHHGKEEHHLTTDHVVDAQGLLHGEARVEERKHKQE